MCLLQILITLDICRRDGEMQQNVFDSSPLEGVLYIIYIILIIYFYRRMWLFNFL